MHSATYDSTVFDATPRETNIQVVIADDYPVLLAGMRQSLALCDDIVVMAESTRICDLLAQVALKKPEIVLLGCELDPDNIAQELLGIADRHLDAKVIGFTGNESLV